MKEGRCIQRQKMMGGKGGEGGEVGKGWKGEEDGEEQERAANNKSRKLVSERGYYDCQSRTINFLQDLSFQLDEHVRGRGRKRGKGEDMPISMLIVIYIYPPLA